MLSSDPVQSSIDPARKARRNSGSQTGWKPYQAFHLPVSRSEPFDQPQLLQELTKLKQGTRKEVPFRNIVIKLQEQEQTEKEVQQASTSNIELDVDVNCPLVPSLGYNDQGSSDVQSSLLNSSKIYSTVNDIDINENISGKFQNSTNCNFPDHFLTVAEETAASTVVNVNEHKIQPKARGETGKIVAEEVFTDPFKIQTFNPSWDEFKDFHAFVEHMELLGAAKAGIALVSKLVVFQHFD